MIISKISPLNNYKNDFGISNRNQCLLDQSAGEVSFKGRFKEPKFLTPIIDNIAFRFVKMIESKPGQKLVEATAKHPKFNKNIFAHLIVAGSTLLSGMYVIKTIGNKNLDSEKRRTLALNQGFVFLLSTVMAYTFDKMLNKKTDAVVAKFKNLNKDLLKTNPAKFNQCIDGIKKGKSIVVIDSVYRFLAPVAVTPVANYIGNRLNEKNAVKNKAVKIAEQIDTQM